MTSLRRRIACAIALLGCAQLAHAEPTALVDGNTVAAEPAALTLERAVELAQSDAPQLNAQEAALDAADARLMAAGRLPDPELLLGVDNVPIDTPDAWSLSRDFMTMRKVGVMQSVPNGRKRSADRHVAQAQRAVIRFQTRSTQLEIARETSIAWIDVMAAELLKKNLMELRPELELQSSTANASLRAARSSSIDALSAQAAVLELDDQLIEAAREVRAARAMLARWIGPDAAVLPLADAPAFDELPQTRSSLLSSLHQHASLVAYESRIALAESEIERARAEKRPDWSAELSYAKRGDVFSDMVSLQFRVGLPLLSGTRQDPLIDAKRADLAMLQAERETELRMHAEEVAGAYAAWESARDRLALFERERIPLARARTQVGLAGFSAGSTPLMDVLSSAQAELQLQRERAGLLRQLGGGWAYLRYLTAQEGAR